MLAAWASALNEGGYWAHVLDAQWRYVFETDELRSTFVDMGKAPTAPTPLGAHVFSTEAKEYFGTMSGDDVETMRLIELGPYVLASTPGGRDELREIVDPEFAARLDELQPQETPAMWLLRPEWTTAGAAATAPGRWELPACTTPSSRWTLCGDKWVDAVWPPAETVVPS